MRLCGKSDFSGKKKIARYFLLLSLIAWWHSFSQVIGELELLSAGLG
jgi:predicted small integral membrane protein